MAIISARKDMEMAAEDMRSAVKAAESAFDKIGLATQDAITAVAMTVGPAIDDARDKIVPLVGSARERIGPVVDDARDRLTPLVEDAKDKLVPAAEQGLAASKAGGRKAAIRLGLAEEPPLVVSHKFRNLLILLGLGALAAFVASRLTGRDVDPAWTAGRDAAAATPPQSATDLSATTTTTATTATSVTTDAELDGSDQSDTAPTAPFPSEETVESHEPTTPDSPLEHRTL